MKDTNKVKYRKAIDAEQRQDKREDGNNSEERKIESAEEFGSDQQTTQIRRTRSSELTILAILFFIVIYCFYIYANLPVLKKKSKNFEIKHQKTFTKTQKLLPDLKEEGEQKRTLVYTEFVERMYGDDTIISTSVDGNSISSKMMDKSEVYLGQIYDQVYNLQIKAIEQKLKSNSKLKNVEKKIEVEKQIEKEREETQEDKEKKKELSKIRDKLKKKPQQNSLPSLIYDRKDPEEYRHIDEFKPYPELPFCLVLSNLEDQNKIEKIYNSVANLRYQNYKLVFAVKKGRSKVESSFDRVTFIENQIQNFYNLKQVAKQKCQPNSVIFPLNQELTPNGLANLNEAYQKNRVWMTYSIQNSKVYIISFFYRILELVEENDFDKTNGPYLTNPGFQFLAYPLLELTQQCSMQMSSKRVYLSKIENSLISISDTSKNQNKRSSYQKLLKLSQSSPIKVSQEESYLQEMMERVDGLEAKQKYLNMKKLIKAFENEDIFYLPTNHSLNKREKEDMNKSFKISQFPQQLPICVTMISKDNMPDKRYQKSILSVIEQDYKNFHIVFIDDHSADETLKETAKFVKDRNFPDSKIQYIKNMETKYPAYNILMAAYEYCQEDEIQVIVEGNDFFIGRTTLKLVNAIYQNNKKLWMAYTSSLTSSYEYGDSKPPVYDSRVVSKDNERLGEHFMSSLSTWRINLIRNIPLSNFLKKNGEFLDVSFQIAMEHPLLEAATTKHFKYIPTIAYFKTLYPERGYVKDQKSVDEKVERGEILSKEPVTPLQSIANAQKIEQNMKQWEQKLKVKGASMEFKALR